MSVIELTTFTVKPDQTQAMLGARKGMVEAFRADRRGFVSQAVLAEFACSYLGGADPTDPLASPVFGDLSGLPPLHIEVGTEEVLIDDSRRLYKHALRDGVRAELVITEGAPHIWQHFASFLAEARDSLERIAHHIWTHIPDRPKARNR